MNTILITGGAGFIGTHLAQELVRADYAVRVLDIRDPKNKIPGVTYIKADVRDRAALRAALSGVHGVFHFAAWVSVPLCKEKPEESRAVNVGGTAGLIEELLRINDEQTRPARLVFSSSAAVYGTLGGEVERLSENQKLPNPLSEYAAQKIECEQLIERAANQRKLPAICFRFFNVYGEGQDPNSPYSGVISIFSERIRKGESIIIYGDGNQTRDFVSVTDVVRGCVKAMSLPASKMTGTQVNLGCGSAVTLNQMAEMMVHISGKTIGLKHTQARDGDVPRSCADIGRARDWLDWVPQVNLEQGLRGLNR